MGKVRNPNLAVNALPMNAFSAYYGFGEKEKKNGLAGVNINHFPFCSGSTNKNKHTPCHP